MFVYRSTTGRLGYCPTLPVTRSEICSRFLVDCLLSWLQTSFLWKIAVMYTLVRSNSTVPPYDTIFCIFCTDWAKRNSYSSIVVPITNHDQSDNEQNNVPLSYSCSLSFWKLIHAFKVVYSHLRQKSLAQITVVHCYFGLFTSLTHVHDPH